MTEQNQNVVSKALLDRIYLKKVEELIQRLISVGSDRVTNVKGIMPWWVQRAVHEDRLSLDYLDNPVCYSISMPSEFWGNTEGEER